MLTLLPLFYLIFFLPMLELKAIMGGGRHLSAGQKVDVLGLPEG